MEPKLRLLEAWRRVVGGLGVTGICTQIKARTKSMAQSVPGWVDWCRAWLQIQAWEGGECLVIPCRPAISLRIKHLLGSSALSLRGKKILNMMPSSSALWVYGRSRCGSGSRNRRGRRSRGGSGSGSRNRNRSGRRRLLGKTADLNALWYVSSTNRAGSLHAELFNLLVVEKGGGGTAVRPEEAAPHPPPPPIAAS